MIGQLYVEKQFLLMQIQNQAKEEDKKVANGVHVASPSEIGSAM